MSCQDMVTRSKGSRAKGRAMLCRMFRNSSASSNSFCAVMATMMPGTSATMRVMSARFHLGTLMFQKPLMTNCPAYVVVSTLLCPDASRPMLQTYRPATAPSPAVSTLPASSSPTFRHRKDGLSVVGHSRVPVGS